MSIEQMENLNGGTDQRNCLMVGGGIAASVVIGFFAPAFFAVAMGGVFGGAAMGCF
ncbi:MAG: hypothetical protein LBI15_08805 [Dysgonamonadaceae bacterium]|nr:hypothetical protein [Dysgonamonadaceae bacterium]